jgi:hypothetical protein
MDDAQVYDTPERIHLFTLVCQRSAVRLEKKGYKHSNGNVTPKLKRHYNLPRSASYDDVLAALERDIKQTVRNPE